MDYKASIPARTLQHLRQHEAPGGKALLEAYDDGGGVWTIGYGTTYHPDGNPVKRGDVMTIEQAEVALLRDARRANDIVDRWITKPLTPGQRRGLLSLVYNIGEGSATPKGKKGFIDGFRHSTTVREFNRGNSEAAGAAMMLWVKAGTPLQTVQGLVNRRNADRKEYNSRD